MLKYLLLELTPDIIKINDMPVDNSPGNKTAGTTDGRIVFKVKTGEYHILAKKLY